MNSSQIRKLLGIACGLSFTFLVTYADDAADTAFKRMDLDGDGKVTRAEYASDAKDIFKKSDADRDSFLTVAELDSFTAAHGRSSTSSADRIKADDSNGDGQLTFAEYEVGTEKLFSRFDANHDGALSKTECSEQKQAKK